MSFLESMGDYRQRVQEIHAAVSSKSDNLDFRMGVPSVTYWDPPAERLKEGLFRKPFLKSNKTWIRQLVIADPKAFAFLAPNIKIELIVEGRLRYWDGLGNEITRDEDDPLDHLKDQLGLYLLEILLGDSGKGFKGLLKGL